MYHSLGRERVHTLKEEVGREQAEAWEQAMQASRGAATARATFQEAYNRQQYCKAKADWDSFGGTPGSGLRQ